MIWGLLLGASMAFASEYQSPHCSHDNSVRKIPSLQTLHSLDDLELIQVQVRN